MDHLEIGNQFYINKEYEKAKHHYEQLLLEQPNNLTGYHNLGLACVQLNQNERAIEILKIPCDHNYTESLLSRGAAYRNIGKYEEAMADFARAFIINPYDGSAYSNYSNSLREFGKPDLAIPFAQVAQKLNPHDQICRLNESIAHLYKGDLISGWEKYDARWFYETGSSLKPTLAGLEYDGSQSLTDYTILVYCEQGFGDCIQFSRYLLLLEKMAKQVVLVSKPKLKTLFKHNFPKINVVSNDDILPGYHYHVALLDLPKCFNTTIDTIPYPTAYLSVSEGLKTEWKKILGPKYKRRIGILCTSNSIAYITRFRKVDIQTLFPIISDEFEFINLSIDYNQEELELLSERGIKSFDMGDFYNTAGLVASLDCVITVDTFMAHLAGALGVPTFVLLHKYGSDWRWFLDRTDSPFYSCVKLIRQTERNKFDDMVLKLKHELALI